MQIKITYPSISDYMDRVVALATKYGKDQWWELNAEDMEVEDRNRFAFIQMAVWDQLWQIQFPVTVESPPEPSLVDSVAFHVQPGDNPGCTFLGGRYWTLGNTQILCPA